MENPLSRAKESDNLFLSLYIYICPSCMHTRTELPLCSLFYIHINMFCPSLALTGDAEGNRSAFAGGSVRNEPLYGRCWSCHARSSTGSGTVTEKDSRPVFLVSLLFPRHALAVFFLLLLNTSRDLPSSRFTSSRNRQRTRLGASQSYYLLPKFSYIVFVLFLSSRYSTLL